MSDWSRLLAGEHTRADPVVSRRDLLSAVGGALALTGAGDGRATLTGSETAQADSDASDVPTWTARATSVFSSETANKLRPLQDDHDHDLKIISHSQLKYLGASYAPNGDPRQGASSNSGSWQHTFVLTTQTLGLEAWWAAPEFNGEHPSSQVIYGPVLKDRARRKNYDLKKVQEQFDERFDEVFGIRNSDYESKIRDRYELGIRPRVEVTGVYPKNNIAVSARRGENLYSFSHPYEVFSMFNTRSGVRLLQAYARIRPNDDINRNVVDSAPFDRHGAFEQGLTDVITHAAESAGESFPPNSSAIATAASFGGAVADIVGLLVFDELTSLRNLPIEIGKDVDEVPVLKYTGGLSLGLSALEVASAVNELNTELEQEPKSVEFFEGFANKGPTWKNPATATTTMFDLYASPIDVEDAGDASVATVRTEKNINMPAINNDNKHIWFVKLPAWPDDPDYDPADGDPVKLVTPEAPEWPIEEEDKQPPNEDDHHITMRPEEDDIVQDGPSPSFSISGPTPTPQIPQDRDTLLRTEDEVLTETGKILSDLRGRDIVLKSGSATVTFDANATRLGGSSIKRYRWDLFKQDPNSELYRINIDSQVFNGLKHEVPKGEISRAEADFLKRPLMASQVLLNSGQGQSAERGWRDGPLFNDRTSLRVEHEFVEPAKYIMILTVEDQQGKYGQHVASFTIADPNPVERDVLSTSLNALDDSDETSESANPDLKREATRSARGTDVSRLDYNPDNGGDESGRTGQDNHSLEVTDTTNGGVQRQQSNDESESQADVVKLPDERVRFNVEVTDNYEAVQQAIVSQADYDADEVRYEHEWAIRNRNDPLVPDIDNLRPEVRQLSDDPQSGEYVISTDDPADVERALMIPGEYEVFVRTIDTFTGETAYESISVDVLELSGGATYTLTVTDSDGVEIGSVTLEDSFTINEYGSHVAFSTLGENSATGDRGVVDHLRLEDGEVIENWETRDLNDYTRTNEGGGRFDIVSSPTSDGDNALQASSGCCGDKIVSDRELIQLQPGMIVEADLRQQTAQSSVYAHKTTVQIGNDSNGSGGIGMELINPGSERIAGARITTPNGEGRIEFEPDLQEFYTFRLDISVAPSNLIDIDPSGTYLRTSRDAATNPSIVSLKEQGIEPGDRIKLEVVGGWMNGQGIPKTATNGVFSGSARLLDDQSVLNRIPDAINAGPDIETRPTYRNGKSTNIPEDFPVEPSVTVTVPDGATHLFLAARANFYEDNADPDGNYGVKIN